METPLTGDLNLSCESSSICHHVGCLVCLSVGLSVLYSSAWPVIFVLCIMLHFHKGGFFMSIYIEDYLSIGISIVLSCVSKTRPS